jgi:3-phosphoshikimate 1-carboxyvinyltransferase
VTSPSATLTEVLPAARLRGRIRVPSDKSVAHRALIANALAGGPAEMTLRAPGLDVGSTADCLRALGMAVEEGADGYAISGRPERDGATLDCGNSGTTMRLLAGALAGLPLSATLDGDVSLRARPMERVASLLRAAGADVATTDGRAPLHISGRERLAAVTHHLPVASAQLIGAAALAALSADGETRIESPGPTRDHTERLLAWMGVDIERQGNVTTVVGPARPAPRSLSVAGDPSSAAAWLVAATIHRDADLVLEDVLLNPTRLKIVEVLRRMGAEIEIIPAESEGPEPTGDLRVRSAERLSPIEIRGDEVAELIDELPLLGVAMAAADGHSELRDAGELRVKESDRIGAVVAGLGAIGAEVEELPDGWRVRRGRPRETEIATHGDHRIAIAFAIAALAGVAETVRLDDAACASVSYPTFWNDLAAVSA